MLAFGFNDPLKGSFTPKVRKPTRDEIGEYRQRLHERAAAGALRYPFAVTEIRKTIGMTQEQFANLIGLTRRQIAEMERNEANPTVETLSKIGKIFGFTVGYVKRTAHEDEHEPPVSISTVRHFKDELECKTDVGRHLRFCRNHNPKHH